MSPWPWVESLGRASLEGAVLIAAVWVVCRALPALPAWSRGMLWWLACARLMLGLLPLAPVALPVVPPATATWWPSAVAGPGPGAVAADLTSTGDAGLVGTTAPARTPQSAAPARPSRRRWDPRALGYAVLGAWLVGVGVRSAGHLRQSLRLRRMCRDASPLSRDRLAALRGLLPDFVRIASSPDAPAPLVTGLFRPLVLLPVSMLDRPLEDLRLAVAHEVGHVRRNDLWLAWVPALAEALFWFHPLLPLCVREYLQACEEACDAHALTMTGAAPYDYGRLLLSLGVHRRLAGATAIPCGSPHPRQLTRRLSMLHDLAPLAPHARRAAWGLIAAFALVGLAPLRIVPTQSISASPSAGVMNAASASAPALAISTSMTAAVEGNSISGNPEREPEASKAGPPIAAVEPGDGGVAIETSSEPSNFTGPPNVHDPDDPDDSPDPVVPESPTTPEPVEPPTAPEPPDEWTDDSDAAYEKKYEKKYERKHEFKARTATPAPLARTARPAHPAKTPRAWGYGYWSDDKADAFSYVIVNPGSESTTGSGQAEDFTEARRLKREMDYEFVWVRKGRDRYVIEDADWVERALTTLAPQREIGDRQAKIGKVQSQIGQAQSRIGERQSRIGAQQAEVAARQSEISRRMSERSRSGRSLRELEREMEELSAEMEGLAADQEELSGQMEPLARQQEELGGQQEALSREMQRAHQEGMRELRLLLEEAIRVGAARRLR